MTTGGSSSLPGRMSRTDALAELQRIRAGSAVPRAMESLAAPVAILNAQRQVIFSNPAFQRLTGLADA
ncbi:MAG TPA: PAS domain-containing protein, partial [Spirochaetia bacterium]|nr:PAS domain-containing protein [Spirochaetia bacterium]